MKKQTFFCLVLSLTAVSGISCNSTCKDNGTCECMTRYDCREGYVCHNGTCVEEDKTEWIIAERKYGETCIAHRECIEGLCLPLGPDNGGVCTKPCKAHEDCPDPENEECKACRIEFGARMREEDDIAPLHDVCGRWALQRDG